MSKHKPSSRKGPSETRLVAFRPVLDRVIFGVALLGLLVTVHLFIQQGRGFDRGCLGFSAPTGAPADCAVVTQSGASELLGVSNAVWGILFYLVIAALSFALPFAARKAATIKKARAGLVVLGFLYSLYLVYYQTVQLDTFCVLCLTSASLVLTLLVLQVIDYIRPPEPSDLSSPAPMTPSLKSREARILGGFAVLVLFLIGADFVYFAGLDRAAGSADNLVLDAHGHPAASHAEDDPNATCQYDPEKAVVDDYQRLVSGLDPYRGSPDGTVMVIEYFDPNCPHCATLYPVMEQVARQHGDKARFYYKPFVLWEHSVAQSAALYAAAQEGKFFEMLELQFANQQQRGLSAAQLRAIAANIGLDADVLMRRIESGMYMSVLQMNNRQGSEIGISSVPTVLINGRFVDTPSKTVGCLNQLIEQAANVR